MNELRIFDMTKSEFIRKIKRRLYTLDPTTPADMVLVDEALKHYPDAPELWCLRGDLIQFGTNTTVYCYHDSLECYEKALQINREFPAAWIGVGEVGGKLGAPPDQVEHAFRLAIDFGGGTPAYSGLARVLEETGRTLEMYEILVAQECLFARNRNFGEMLANVVAVND